MFASSTFSILISVLMAVARTRSTEPDVLRSAVYSCGSIGRPDTKQLGLTSHVHIVYAHSCEPSIVLVGGAERYHGSSSICSPSSIVIAGVKPHIILTASTISSTE